MGSTYVYNMGSDDPLKRKELELSFGLFFDGTGNNFYNTRARKRTYGIDEYADQSIPENRPTWIDKKLTREYAEGTELNLKTLEKQGKDNSYTADFTNVARRYYCCDRDSHYPIYIEGVGTQQVFNELGVEITDTKKREDETLPKAHGLGITGVRTKVRRGCEELARRIYKVKKDYGEDYKLTTITIDVFGFSRGAAAARNFLYEINGDRRPEDNVVKKRGVVGYKKNTFRNFGNDYREFVPVYGDVYEYDGIKLEQEFLEKEKLPKFGYLGYCLLKEDVLSKEELKKMWLSVRFVGVYDTVASYLDGHINIKGFSSGEESLQLNNIGRYRKAIHFTADDEHRKFFALTNLEPKKGGDYQEFSLPGVHSDIGGSYSTGREEVILEVFDSLRERYGFSPMELIKPPILKLMEGYIKDRKEKQIIQSYIDNKFFTSEELSLEYSTLIYKDIKGTMKKLIMLDWKSLFFDNKYVVLKGIRKKVYKEYSYIPLHFMDEFFEKLIGDTEYDKLTTENIKTKYSYGDDKTLKYAEKRLRQYVFDGGNKWKFLSKEQIQLRETLEQIKKGDIKVQPPQEEVKKDKLVVRQKPIPNILIEKKPKPIPEFEEKEIKEIIFYPDQMSLYKLRNKYLHWSADFAQIGMEPILNRIRRFSKKGKK